MSTTKQTALRLTGACLLLSFLSLTSKSQTKDPGAVIGAKGKVMFTYQGKSVILATVRAADGNIWLQQNLGSLYVATAYDDKLSFGDLFQWGRWDDGHQVRDPDYSSNKLLETNNPIGLKLSADNPFIYGPLKTWWYRGQESDHWDAAKPMDVTASNGCDPCKALGEGWRLPTIEEWENVIKLEDITSGSTSMHSNLKLSLAGSRDYHSPLIYNRPPAGAYWSSTAYDNGGAHAISLGIAFAKSELFYRGIGASIRCLKAKQ